MSEPRITHVCVNRELCQSAATCLAYQFYELDDEAKAVVLTNNGSNSDDPSNPQQTDGTVAVENVQNPDQLEDEAFQQHLLESAQSCPFNAIILTDAEGENIWPPTV